MVKKEERNKEYKFISLMEDYVVSQLNGSHKDFDFFVSANKPSKKFIIGSLCAEDPEQLDKPNFTSARVSTLSVSFLASKKMNVSIDPNYSVFHKIKSVEDEEVGKKENTPKNKEYKRFQLEEENIELDDKSKESILSSDILSNQLKDEYKLSESETPIWTIKIRIEYLPYKQNGIDSFLHKVYLTNVTPLNQKYETTIFEANMIIKLDEPIIPFEFSYTNNSFPKKVKIPLQTSNCDAEISADEKTISTKYYKRHVSSLIEPKTNLMNFNNDKIEYNFSILGSEKRYEVFYSTLEFFKEYLKFYEDNIPNEESHIYQEYLFNIENYKRMISRFSDSIEVIKNNEIADRAFVLMQKTFNSASKYPGWRLFQIIFIVNTIADIVSKNNYETTELLHVDTGGGKSEAYFGIVVFASFYERLIGKTFGVTAITKFPLRMLSIQQLQRIANIFIWAEEIRKREKISGDPFSVAYYVGSSSEFPNKNRDLLNEISKGDSKGKIIAICPICEKEENKISDVMLKVDEKDATIVHYCSHCNREFRLYYTDEEIYRKLPTFIISTVDKLAGISYNRRFRSLIGGKVNLCEKGHGYIPKGDICSVSSCKCESEGTEVLHDFDSGPCVIIQDEMHLIREGFGTIDSHFETFIEEVKKMFTGKGFKNIAMTATISGAEYQIKQLYNKKTETFPPTSPLGKGVSDPFFELHKDVPHRICLGIKPNVQENRFAIRTSLHAISKFFKVISENVEHYSRELDLEPDELLELMKFYKSYLSYHNKKDDVQNMNYFITHQSDDTQANDDDFSINPKTLTGENTLDEIRELIKLIEDQDTKSEKNLITVFATNIVSHGVDIEKWNVMFFQGIARSTSEYLQALSRIGRKHVGLAFIWFYPSRIRDISTFSNFTEYNKYLDHHVEKVPILRWAKLGFKQTINSLFCGCILNYFSEKLETPIYRVEEVNLLFSQPGKNELREEMIKLLEKAYCTNSDPESAKYFIENIPSEIEKRFNKLFKYQGAEINYFPAALAESRDPYFSNQFGMRGIQPSFGLEPVPKQGRFIYDYFKYAKREE